MSLREQFRSVIEWSDPDPSVLFVRWTEHGDEIKNASKLVVGPGQGCIFVYEGRVRAVHQEEGLVDLATDNVPFWTTIKSALQGFVSEHKVGIYYFRRADLPNLRWGLPGTIRYVDPVYRFPVGIGAFGNYSVRIVEPDAFFRSIVAGASVYAARDLQRLILSRISPIIADVLGKSQLSYVQVDAHRGEISAAVTQQVLPVFRALGFELTDFRIEGTSFDEETQARIGKIADMSAAAQAAAAAGIDYAQMQRLEAMRDALKAPGSPTGLAANLVAGWGLGQMLGGPMLGGPMLGSPAPGVFPAPGLAAPPPAPPASSGDDIQAKLVKLKQLHEAGLIDAQEYGAKKKELLERL